MQEIKYDLLEQKSEHAYMRKLLTSCPNGKVGRNTNFRIKVGGGACVLCNSFVAVDTEERIVVCKYEEDNVRR